MQPIYHPDAQEELFAAAEYYELRAPGLGGPFLDEIAARLTQLQDHPELGATYHSGTRRLVLDQFPFSLIYRVEALSIVVFAVMHHSREPGYWRKRLQP